MIEALSSFLALGVVFVLAAVAFMFSFNFERKKSDKHKDTE
jgi:hypothetical protein